MAVATTKVPGADTVFGNKRVKVRDIAFSGTYPTGGETITAASVGLKTINVAIADGGQAEVDLTGGFVAKMDYQTDGSVKVVLYEVGVAGPLTQKPAEAYDSASELRVVFIGH